MFVAAKCVLGSIFESALAAAVVLLCRQHFVAAIFDIVAATANHMATRSDDYTAKSAASGFVVI